MEKPYARVGEDGVQFSGPNSSSLDAGDIRIGVFGSHADDVVRSVDISKLTTGPQANAKKLSLIAIPSDTNWGKSANDLVNAVYKDRVLALIALDRPSSHLAEQIGVKSFVPVVALSSDRSLTSTNIPWIFRFPEGTPVEQAVKCLFSAISEAGPSRSSIRELLASGTVVGGVRFDSSGEVRP
jgi:hypothetical protein